jgi:excisionase family DNA binding protein
MMETKRTGKSGKTSVPGAKRTGVAKRSSAHKKGAGRSRTQSSSLTAPKAATAKSAAPVRPRKAPARKRPPRTSSPQVTATTLKGALLVPVTTPQRDRIRQVERIMARASEVTILEGKTTVKIAGETLMAMRQIIAALSSGPLSLLLGDKRDTELTSQEVADLLNVSRPYIVKLAREGKLPHKMVGNRHRFLLSDVQEYASRQRVKRERALASIVPEAGYTTGDF